MCVPRFLNDHRCGHYRVQWQTCWVAQELDYNKSQAFRCWQRYITSPRALNSGVINPEIDRVRTPPPCVIGGVVCTEIGELQARKPEDKGAESDCPLIGDHKEVPRGELRSDQWIVSCNKHSQAVWMSELLESRSCHLLLYGHYVWRGRSSVMLHYVNPHKTKELTWEEIAIPIAKFDIARSQDSISFKRFLAAFIENDRRAAFIENDRRDLHEGRGTQDNKPYELSLLTSAQVSLFRNLKQRKPRLEELTPGDLIPIHDWKEHRASLIESAENQLSLTPVESLRNTKIKTSTSFPDYASSSSTFASQSVPRRTIPPGHQQLNSNAVPANMTRSFSEDPAAHDVLYAVPPMARSHTQASSGYSQSVAQPLYHNLPSQSGRVPPPQFQASFSHPQQSTHQHPNQHPTTSSQHPLQMSVPPLVVGQSVYASNPHWQPAHSYDRPPPPAGISLSYPQTASQIETSAIPPHGFPPQYQSQTMYSQAPQAYIPLPSSSFSGQFQVSVQHNQPQASTSGAPRLPPGWTEPHPVQAPTRGIDSHPGPSHHRHHH